MRINITNIIAGFTVCLVASGPAYTQVVCAKPGNDTRLGSNICKTGTDCYVSDKYVFEKRDSKDVAVPQSLAGEPACGWQWVACRNDIQLCVFRSGSGIQCFYECHTTLLPRRH